MKRNIAYLFFLILFLLPSCCYGPDTGDEIVKIETPSFVLGYYSSSGITLSQDDERTLLIRDRQDNPDREFYNFQVNQERYRQLSEKHDDLRYNKKIEVDLFNGFEQCIAFDFVSVRVTSDVDFDAGHPAGSSLGDLIRFRSVSPYRYIQSGYAEEYSWKTSGKYDDFTKYFPAVFTWHPMGGDRLHPIDKMLSELQPEDLILLGPNYPYSSTLATLYFASLPVFSKTHAITVSMTTDEGEVFSDTITMTFQ